MNPKKIMNIAIPVAIGAIVVTVPTVIVATEDIRHRPILPESWVDLTNPYHPAIEAVTGPITEKADYEAAVDCKEYYFDKVSKNPDIYKEDFYFGHSMYLKGISMDTGAIVKNAAAYIHDISCQKTQYQYDWVPYTGSPSYPVTIYAMSFTAEFSVTMTEVSRYLHMDDVTKVVNKGKFVVKDMPMWLEFYDKRDFSYTYGHTPSFFIYYLYLQESPFVENFKWSVEQDTQTTLTRKFGPTGIEYTVDIPMHLLANDKETFNILYNEDETIAGVDDICSSFYMSKIDNWGK